jgi:hypothetical protein
VLHGRGPERARLDGLLADARASRSQALVLRGQPGVGKSALLDWTASRAAPARCLRASGVESELELPFALLHQLLHPVLDHLGALPPVQAQALRGALGLGPGQGKDRFLVAVGVLTVLAEAAADHGLVCIVDDAHWADSASMDALLFAARRLEAEGVVLLFAARDGEADAFAAPGLPGLVLQGLDDEAAAALMAEHAPMTAEPVRRTLVDGTGGNPLALIELTAALTSAQLAGTERLPEPLPVGLGIQRMFAGVAARLAEPSRVLLTVAASDDTGRLAVIGRAANALGVDLDALGDAEAAGLVAVTAAAVEFRHPLVRSAVYQQAPFTVRQAAHRALAAALDDADDLDRRAWHLAAAATPPDAAVSAELERTAARARVSGARLGDLLVAEGHVRRLDLYRALAEQWGVPFYRFLAMPHPIANLTERELDQRAREITPEVVKLLLTGQS